MSVKARYEVYKPLNNGKWEFLLSAHIVNKEGGALEQLEDVITTGVDARVAVILDTEKMRHVPIFRVNVNGQTKIKPLAGGWKNGDCGIVGNTNVEQIADLAKELNEQLAEESDSTLIPDSVQADNDETVLELISNSDYEGQPDYVVLNWIMGDYDFSQYVIPTPTERQLKALNIAHGGFLGADLPRRQEAALLRISAALTVNPEHCESLVADNPQLAQWVGIWANAKVGTDEGSIRIENSTVEVIFCGHII